ncbi:MAG TPA: WSC domain-containing protein [Pyrinomonadaceae bacterium]|jgi:hypothetical protein
MKRWVMTLVASLAMLALLTLSQPAKSRGETNYGTVAIQGSRCFDIDPGIGNTNRDDHYRWAQQQDSTKLMNNLAWKIGILFNCSSVSGDQLAKGFGQMSGIIADYVSNPACFNNDPAVTGKDRSAHERWARTKTREQVRDNLQWKAVAAMKCLDRDYQVAFFADESVALARIPSSDGGGAGGGGEGGGKGSGQYLGCWKDTDYRDVGDTSQGGYYWQDANMTTERCIASCSGKGYAYAATQSSSYCFCGNTYGKYGRADNCNMKCGGDSGQTCGGTYANSVYRAK